MKSISLQIPATSANLGPGFDCMAVALDLWSEVEFRLTGNSIGVAITGEGAGSLPDDQSNLIARAFLRVYAQCEQHPPPGVEITCINRVPIGSGLGSSAAAVLAGLVGANALLGSPLSEGEIFALGTQIEGHPDNLVPAYLGGLTLVSQAGREVIARKIEIPPMQAAVVVPKISLLTEETRRALPLQVALTEAVQNIGNAALVVEALRTGDVDLLAQVCGDNLHQPYRLPLIPGAQAALEAAQNLGAAAVLSGGGPGVIAFVDDRPGEAAAVMAAEFEKAGLESRTFLTDTTNQGAADTII